MLPTRMSAARFQRFGPPDVLEVAERPLPEPGPGEVLLRVRAAGVNPADAAARAVQLHFGPADPFPLYPGWDVAGEVVGLGAGVDGFAIGDEVFGLVGFPKLAGTHAQYAAVPAGGLAERPDQLDWAEAGAVPLVGLTVLQAFAAGGGIRPGQRVLVEAAAGGVGHIAVQIAKAAGGHVLGVASAANHEFLRGLGVDEPIDYKGAEDIYTGIEPPDVVLSSGGAETAARATRRIAPGGFLVSIRSGVTDAVAAVADSRRVRHANILVRPDRAGILELAVLARAGLLRVEVSGRYPLAEIVAAHRQIETRRTTGKIVIVPES
jgi:NADPH:quinone reductase-like Zn-dependent oxidoreductase